MNYRNTISKQNLSHGTVITKADFSNTYFSDIRWEDVIFDQCDFSDSFFEGYWFLGCRFINCKFSNVLWSSFSELADVRQFEGCCFVGSNCPQPKDNSNVKFDNQKFDDQKFDDDCFWDIDAVVFEGVWHLLPIKLGDKKKK